MLIYKKNIWTRQRNPLNIIFWHTCNNRQILFLKKKLQLQLTLVKNPKHGICYLKFIINSYFTDLLKFHTFLKYNITILPNDKQHTFLHKNNELSRPQKFDENKKDPGCIKNIYKKKNWFFMLKLKWTPPKIALFVPLCTFDVTDWNRLLIVN